MDDVARVRRTAYHADASGQRALDAAYVAVLVPVYNEDSAWLRRSLASLLARTRLPDSVNVVDDGSNVAYDDVRKWFLKAAADAGVAATWKRTVNRGKRHAQVTAAADAPHADFFLTIDSDADLDRACIHEILQPFARPEVESVAAVVLCANTRARWLTRLFDVYRLRGNSTTAPRNRSSAPSSSTPAPAPHIGPLCSATTNTPCRRRRRVWPHANGGSVSPTAPTTPRRP
ncbi:glycosyltransferase [Uniformispora flossi]|uniref:glycosyltransferase n=1 Tax=Uniformispora flossi TaxID=3390723 RepID=UPI003C2C8F7F